MPNPGMPHVRLAERSVKPRTTGLTGVLDQGMGYSETQSFLEACGDYVDYYKFIHISVVLAREELTRRKVKLCREHDVIPFTGGVLLEIAHCQGEVDGAIGWLRDTGFLGVEFSDNMVVFTPEQKREIIGKCVDAGLQVVYEYGRKYYNEGDSLEADEVAEEIRPCLDAGAKLVILEESVLDLWIGRDGRGKESHKLVELTRRIGPEKIFYEVSDKKQYPALVKLFGPDANFGPNVIPPEVGWLESGRRGYGRAFGYSAVVEAFEKYQQEHR